MKNKWKNIAALLGAADIEASSDGVFLSEEQMDAIQTRLAGDEVTIAEHAPALKAATDATGVVEAALQTEKEAHTATKATLTQVQTELSTQAAANTTLVEEVTGLKATLSGKPVKKVAVATAPTTTVEQNEADFSLIDELPHNKAADALLGGTN